jgi:hypothetical protein
MAAEESQKPAISANNNIHLFTPSQCDWPHIISHYFLFRCTGLRPRKDLFGCSLYRWLKPTAKDIEPEARSQKLAAFAKAMAAEGSEQLMANG